MGASATFALPLSFFSAFGGASPSPAVDETFALGAEVCPADCAFFLDEARLVRSRGARGGSGSMDDDSSLVAPVLGADAFFAFSPLVFLVLGLLVLDLDLGLDLELDCGSLSFAAAAFFGCFELAVLATTPHSASPFLFWKYRHHS